MIDLRSNQSERMQSQFRPPVLSARSNVAGPSQKKRSFVLGTALVLLAISTGLLFLSMQPKSRSEYIEGQAKPGDPLVTKPMRIRHPVTIKGINVAGAEFGEVGHPNHELIPYPGIDGTNYIIPQPSESLLLLAEKGMNLFRIPVRWERLQPDLSKNVLNRADLQKLKKLVAFITVDLNSEAMIDLHNYCRYNKVIIGTDHVVSVNRFQAFWTMFANEFKDNPKVSFSLMNEPFWLPQDDYVKIANAGLVGLRNSGSKNLVLVSGGRWSGAHSWFHADRWGPSNAESMLAITDPGNNMMWEIHQYFDSDYSGESKVCVSETIGSEKLTAITEWMREYKQRAFLAEFAVASNDVCLKALDDMLGFMEENGDVWNGWAWWNAGPWIGDYVFGLNPRKDTKDKPQFEVLDKYLKARNISAPLQSKGPNFKLEGLWA